jgi:hypothetical protein
MTVLYSKGKVQDLISNIRLARKKLSVTDALTFVFHQLSSLNTKLKFPFFFRMRESISFKQASLLFRRGLKPTQLKQKTVTLP